MPNVRELMHSKGKQWLCHRCSSGPEVATMNRMQNQPRGFTMIELIVVIVILGILAATALPKFVDLSGDAKAAALQGVASAAAGAMSMNYAGCSATSNSTSGANAAKCTLVRYCDDVIPVLSQPLTSEYTISHTDLSVVNGATGNCTMTQTSTSSTQTFWGISAGNP